MSYSLSDLPAPFDAGYESFEEADGVFRPVRASRRNDRRATRDLDETPTSGRFKNGTVVEAIYRQQTRPALVAIAQTEDVATVRRGKNGDEYILLWEVDVKKQAKGNYRPGPTGGSYRPKNFFARRLDLTEVTDITDVRNRVLRSQLKRPGNDRNWLEVENVDPEDSVDRRHAALDAAIPVDELDFPDPSGFENTLSLGRDPQDGDSGEPIRGVPLSSDNDTLFSPLDPDPQDDDSFEELGTEDLFVDTEDPFVIQFIEEAQAQSSDPQQAAAPRAQQSVRDRAEQQREPAAAAV